MEESNTAKWVVVGLIGLGLVGFGYKVYNDQRSRPAQVMKGPISVAAVRGGNDGGSTSLSSVPSMAGEYAKSLQEDVSLAEKNAAKYQAAGKAREAAAQEAAAHIE